MTEELFPETIYQIKLSNGDDIVCIMSMGELGTTEINVKFPMKIYHVMQGDDGVLQPRLYPWFSENPFIETKISILHIVTYHYASQFVNELYKDYIQKSLADKVKTRIGKIASGRVHASSKVMH